MKILYNFFKKDLLGWFTRQKSEKIAVCILNPY